MGLTVPNPLMDWVGLALRIKRYICAGSRCVVAAKAAVHPASVPYVMADVALTHHGDDCTFETLLRRFSIRDPALRSSWKFDHFSTPSANTGIYLDRNPGKLNGSRPGIEVQNGRSSILTTRARDRLTPRPLPTFFPP